MDPLPPPPAGMTRIRVAFRPGLALTPGELASATGAPLDAVGLAQVLGREAVVDVREALVPEVRPRLDRLGRTALVDWVWRWLRIDLGRNHGLSMGRLRKLLLDADALPAGKIHLNNSHSMVGVQGFRVDKVLRAMAPMRVNGWPVKAQVLPEGTGPGSAAFLPGR
jgi:hypothetical protein